MLVAITPTVLVRSTLTLFNSVGREEVLQDVYFIGQLQQPISLIRSAGGNRQVDHDHTRVENAKNVRCTRDVDLYSLCQP